MKSTKGHAKPYAKLLSLVIIGMLLIPTVALANNQTNTIGYNKNQFTRQVSSDTYHLLIITADKFQQELQPLVEHKNAYGMTTNLVTLSEVYEEMYWEGRDEPEKIKYYIKHAIEEWGITYVLLVGDFRLMPIRYCYNAFEEWGEPRFISELYYADIYDENGSFSSWDANNNGIFGEWYSAPAEDAGIDLYPDVAVGRLACRNAFEVKIMVNKIINYEQNTYGSDWFNTIVVAGGDTYPTSMNPNWTELEGEENTKRVIENMTGFENITLWTSDGSFTGVSDMIRAINPGCGFIYMDGHANPYRWSTHPPDDKTVWINGLSVLTMSLLRNKKKLPVCVVGGCHNLQFDVHLGKLREEHWMYFTWIAECWGWKLTRKVGGGSIATIGCSGLGMTKEDKVSFSGAGDYLEPTFFYEYGQNGTQYLGETWAKTIINYINKYPVDWSEPAAGDHAIDAKTVQQWILLGDPSLRIGGYP